jgi:N-acetylglucosaminyldiphosphoundecaprenol N-acetyl-beta-D-mannosaminyltransferase
MMGGHSQSQPRIFGLSVTEGSAQDTCREVIRLRPERAELIVTPNIDHIVNLRRDVGFARAYHSAAIVACDGFPVRYYAALRGIAVQRVTGIDILQELMAGSLCNHRLFFVVDSDETAMAVHSWARQRDVVVETAVPPFDFGRDQDYCRGLVQQINAHDTSILIMGVGAPTSEIWVDTHRANLPPCWALCVGQGVRVACGITHRAPVLLRRLNCEWLWRICQEPGRLWWRYSRGLLLFPLAVLEDQLNNWLSHLAWRQTDGPPAHIAPVSPKPNLAKTMTRPL